MIRIVGAGKQQHDGECHRRLVIIVMVVVLLLMLLMLLPPVMVLVRMMLVPRAWRTPLAGINSVVERQEFPVLPAPLRAGSQLDVDRDRLR